MGKELSSSLVGLGVALGSGMWTVAAVEGIKAIVGHFREAKKEAEEAAKRAKEEWEKSLQAIDQGVKRLKDRLLELRGIDPLLYEYQTRLVETARKINDIRREQALENVKNEQNPRLAALKQQYQDLVRLIREYQEKLREVKGEEASKDAGKRADKDAETREKTAEQVAGYLLQKSAEVAKGEEKIALELQAELQAIHARSADMTQAEYDAEIAAATRAHDQKLRLHRLEIEDRLRKSDTVDHYTEEFELGPVDKNESLRAEAKYRAEVEAAKEAKEHLRKEFDDLERSIERGFTAPVAQSFQGLFMTLVDGSINSFSKLRYAIENIGKAILSSLVGLLTQMLAKKAAAYLTEHLLNKTKNVAEVTSAAGVAGAEAAASQAGIPIVGPALAAAAMATTSAAVMSSMLPLASAAGGYDIPGTINPLVQAHAREMVLPEELADRVRSMTDGGGNTYVIQAMDSRSFERFLRDNSDALARGIDQAVRDRRL
jgi:hypothetical protein